MFFEIITTIFLVLLVLFVVVPYRRAMSLPKNNPLNYLKKRVEEQGTRKVVVLVGVVLQVVQPEDLGAIAQTRGERVDADVIGRLASPPRLGAEVLVDLVKGKTGDDPSGPERDDEVGAEALIVRDVHAELHAIQEQLPG